MFLTRASMVGSVSNICSDEFTPASHRNSPNWFQQFPLGHLEARRSNTTERGGKIFGAWKAGIGLPQDPAHGSATVIKRNGADTDRVWDGWYREARSEGELEKVRWLTAVARWGWGTADEEEAPDWLVEEGKEDASFVIFLGAAMWGWGIAEGEEEETAAEPLDDGKGVPSGAMFWIVMWTSGMEELNAVCWPDFRVGPWSKLRQCGGTYFVASFKLYKWQCESLDIYPSTCIEAYHLFCPESHFLMGEMVVVVGTTLVSNMTMAVVSFASSFIRKLLVGHILSIILIIRHCHRGLVLLLRPFSFWFHLLWCLSSFQMSWLFLSLIFMKNNSLLHSWPLGLTL